MKSRFCSGAALLAGCVALAGGCTPRRAAPPAPPPAPVTVAKPASAAVQSYYEYNGYLEEIEHVDIRARVKGFLEGIHFTEGDEVAAGARLYTIDPREYQSAVSKAKADIKRALADIENAKAQVRLGESDLKRLRGLQGSIAAGDVDKAEAQLAAGRAQLDVTNANKSSAEAALRNAELQLGYTTIDSPIQGQIGRTQVTKGNLVGQGPDGSTLLTTVVSVDPLFVYFDIPERDLVEYQQSLRAGATQAPTIPDAAVPVEVGVATEEGFPHKGAIDFRDNRVETGTGTVRIRGRVPNPLVPPGNARLLYPGLFARVRVPSGPPRTLLAIPEEALLTGQEGRFVYVVGPEDKVLKRTVTVGPNVWRSLPPDAKQPPAWALANPKPAADGKPPPPGGTVRSVVAITAGLTADDRVIVNGLQRARPGGAVLPEEWELKGPAK